jgi:hypothetical protein
MSTTNIKGFAARVFNAVFTVPAPSATPFIGPGICPNESLRLLNVDVLVFPLSVNCA